MGYIPNGFQVPMMWWSRNLPHHLSFLPYIPCGTLWVFHVAPFLPILTSFCKSSELNNFLIQRLFFMKQMLPKIYYWALRNCNILIEFLIFQFLSILEILPDQTFPMKSFWATKSMESFRKQMRVHFPHYSSIYLLYLSWMHSLSPRQKYSTSPFCEDMTFLSSMISTWSSLRYLGETHQHKALEHVHLGPQP